MKKNLFKAVLMGLVTFSCLSSFADEPYSLGIDTSNVNDDYDGRLQAMNNTYDSAKDLMFVTAGGDPNSRVDSARRLAFENSGNNAVYAVDFKGHTFLFNYNTKNKKEIVCLPLDTVGSTSANHLQCNNSRKTVICSSDADPDLEGSSLVACAYNQELYVFYAKKRAGKVYIYYKTSVDPFTKGWKRENQLASKAEEQIGYQHSVASDNIKPCMAAAVLNNKLYFFYSGHQDNDRLEVWSYDKKRSGGWKHEESILKRSVYNGEIFGSIYAQTVVKNGQESIAIVTVNHNVPTGKYEQMWQEGTYDGDGNEVYGYVNDNNKPIFCDKVRIFFYNGVREYKVANNVNIVCEKASFEFSKYKTPQYVQVRTLYGFTNGFGSNSLSNLQLVLSYRSNVKIFNYDLENADFLEFTVPKEEKIGSYAVPVVSFMKPSGSLNLQAYCHFIDIFGECRTIVSDYFTTKQGQILAFDKTKKPRILIGVIEGMPPFIGKDSSYNRGSVNVSMQTDNQNSVSSTDSTVFSKVGGMSALVLSAALAQSGGFTKLKDNSNYESISENYSFWETSIGWQLYLEADVEKQEYEFKDKQNPKFDCYYVSALHLEPRTYYISDPPQGMATREVAQLENEVKIKYWKTEFEKYKPYKKIKLGSLTIVRGAQGSLQLSAGATTSMATSEDTSYTADANFTLGEEGVGLLTSADIAAVKSITNQSSFSFSKMLSITGSTMYEFPIGGKDIYTMKVDVYLYFPNEGEKAPWVPDTDIGSSPWLLTWVVTDTLGRNHEELFPLNERRSLLQKTIGVMSSAGQAVVKGISYVFTGGHGSHESKSQDTAQSQQGPTIISVH